MAKRYKKSKNVYTPWQIGGRFPGILFRDIVGTKERIVPDKADDLRHPGGILVTNQFPVMVWHDVANVSGTEEVFLIADSSNDVARASR